MNQDEISLREILEIIWNGKWIIAIITTAALIVASIFSYFIAVPEYEASSVVRFEFLDEKNNYLNSFSETLKSDVSINRIIEKLALDKSKYSIRKIQNNTRIEVIKDTNVMRIVVKGNEPDTITSITNLMAFELGARTEISDRAQKIVDLNNRLVNIEEQIIILNRELNEVSRLLEQTPERLVTKQTLANDPFLMDIMNDFDSKFNSKDLAALQLESETINPLFTELTSRSAQITVNIKKYEVEKANYLTQIDVHHDRIQELENQINKEKLTSTTSERLTNGFQAVFISPAIEPTHPIAPNNVLNLVIGAMIGLIIGLMAVFIRHYWNGSSPTSSNNHSASI